ncbi:MAG: beta-galactosidase [Verrucomicrobiales bacterium]|nr:beta-galactosidase [Verrucomicrobiales bacterium]
MRLPALDPKTITTEATRVDRRPEGDSCRAAWNSRNPSVWWGVGLVVAAMLWSFPGWAADRPLFRPAEAKSEQVSSTKDTRVEWIGEPTSRRVRVQTGTNEPWPGITIQAQGGPWDLRSNAWVVVRLRNAGPKDAKVFCRVDNPGADGEHFCVTADVTLAAGASGALRVPLSHQGIGTLDGRLFGLRGYPAAPRKDRTLDPSRINQVLLFQAHPTEPAVFEVERIDAEGAYVPPTAWVSDADPYLPFIDILGQYRHRDWPGKTPSVEALAKQRAEEERALAARPGPPNWSRYGGWSGGPRLKATGFFRVTKHQDRWWLVDPEGYLFWSHGVDCVMMLDFTPVEGREDWYQDFPGALPEFARYTVENAFCLKGHYAGKRPRSFSFAGANLARKYGTQWSSVVPDVIHRRLRSWGMNTIGNWSSDQVTRRRRTAYTDAVQSENLPMIEGSEGYWGKFPDVYSAKFAQGVARAAQSKRGGSAGDPWCLGYFSDNEMSWGDDVSLAEAALRSPPEQPAKQAFIADLRSKYREIASLNQKWGTTHVDWEAVAASRVLPPRDRAREDLEAFYTRTAETYFRTVRDALREVAPGQLYLGCRFAWANARAAAAAAKYCDVVSYNLYQRGIRDFDFNGGADVPLIVGEFHFGALDRGMFHTGLVPVPDQASRAEAYRAYVMGALEHPQFVGTHWFQWQDEPVTGRVYDEENYQIGLIDVADTPYAETIEAVRSVGERLYEIRSKAKP